MGGFQITTMNWTPERDAEIRQRYGVEGETAASIAKSYSEMFGVACTRSMIIGRARRIGVRGKRRPGFTESQEKKMQARKLRRSQQPLVANLTRRRRLPPGGLRDVLERSNAPAPALISTVDLTPFQCAWVQDSYGTNDDCVRLHCGLHAADPARPYCTFHRAIVYRPVVL